MAITDVDVFAHLTDGDIENLSTELDDIRRDIEESRGERDARYIYRTIAAQRALEVGGRLVLAASSRRSAWWVGAVTLSVAKIIENMEIGHNVMHGQWDWMNDPEVHSSTWEWDMASTSKHWRYTHNVVHHKYTNILDMDHDVGYGMLRVTRDQGWRRRDAFNLAINTLLAIGFEWGIALRHLEARDLFKDGPEREAAKFRLREFSGKAGRQAVKDYVAFPALTSVSPAATYRSTLTANAFANVIRNVWSNAVIFCGHFPDGAEKFTKTDLVDETQGQWYLRQMLGSANFNAGPAMRFMSGSLSHQIEHHLYPDLPSNRLAEVSVRVREICDKYDLPYTTGSFPLQYAKTWRTLAKLSLPNKYLRDNADDAPETRSERMFAGLEPGFAGTDPMTGRRRGLKAAITAVRGWRRAKPGKAKKAGGTDGLAA
ncbi:Stearoyl-CoA 9-desaturase [Mycobacterium marinum]|uniref:Stearoyl-CoA 9-desaturase n=1 Tax=Mycobacterium shottsii TaxID=133549 RepID=A0A7I7LM41_9MYCO|nr:MULTISPECIES: fatty acid desaturase [Mycobacterium ulcerans group]AXN43229.1 Stearoyl-CoA 9-desaturase [Mycobacterium marinum]AXN48690.1 Stearoyl-CoA 9-desaturase [Mycobacterium marinum]EPQ70527.1 PUTATIVE LINOLEOYL-CoA DESATURASE (DELTA(6)-DESATURASE) [Mycobacterium marinum str. Europe]QYL30168.1 Stearoyl-CoA 9-desaturase [Mycobacterium shottsii]RFZ11718.1 Stearoyl-CoA 9-desaturase [Mycobacterium marinum]